MTKSPSFRSGFEKKVYEKAEGSLEYETTKIPYIQKHNYIADFTLSNGVLIETKGRLTSIDRRKMLDVKRCNPELDIRFVFQRASNVIRKGSKTTYADWAVNNGFQWAEGLIPLEWWSEKNGFKDST